MRRGKVYITGAGPGDPKLLTLRALEVLRIADVVVYDRLVSPEVLGLAPRRAVKTYGGKAPGCGKDSQQRLNELMLREARLGKAVVRLKGGDPFLFSRGGEEVEFLRRHGVELEVVPGVSSVIGVPAYAGIPLTHRDHASSVMIVTGHQVESGFRRRLDWSRVAGSSDTLVILMGVSGLASVSVRLLEGGLPADTPVAAIEWGTTGRQKVLLLTLAEAARGYRSGYVGSPGLVVIGSVASLAPRLWWNGKGKVRASPGYAALFTAGGRVRDDVVPLSRQPPGLFPTLRRAELLPTASVAGGDTSCTRAGRPSPCRYEP